MFEQVITNLKSLIVALDQKKTAVEKALAALRALDPDYDRDKPAEEAYLDGVDEEDLRELREAGPAETPVELPRKKRGRPRGAGAVYQKVPGGVFYIRFSLDGVRYAESTGTRSRFEAEKILAERMLTAREERLSGMKKNLEEYKQKNGHADNTLQPENLAALRKHTPAEPEPERASDEKCWRCPSHHTYSQHDGGKCLLCWCPGFVGGEQFRASK